jgi:hypothetical protein
VVLLFLHVSSVARSPCDGAGFGSNKHTMGVPRWSRWPPRPCSDRRPVARAACPGPPPGASGGAGACLKRPCSAEMSLVEIEPCPASLVELLVPPPGRLSYAQSAVLPAPSTTPLQCWSIPVGRSASCIPFLHCRTPQRACSSLLHPVTRYPLPLLFQLHTLLNLQ